MAFVDVFDQLANVAQVARKCPTPTLRRAYVTALRDWCAQTQWLRVSITGATVEGTQLYSLGSDPLLEIVGVFAMSASYTPPGGNIQKWPVASGDPTNWDPNMPNGRPTRYAYIPEGQISLYNTPDGVYNILTSAIVQPKEGVTQIPAEPLKKYSTYLEAGALAYLLSLKGTPWHDPREAATQEAKFKSGISNGKAEVQRSFNTGAQRVRPRAFMAG